MPNPIISIITPSFNRADIVHETAASIFAQTYPHWEWVIVDDGSTDNSWERLQEYAAKDARVKIFKRDREPKGACACRNIAVEKSTGDHLIFLDTDDLVASFCLQQRMETIQQYPDCDFVIFPMLLFKDKPDDLKLLWNIDKPADDIDRILLGDAVCQGTGTLWKKSSFVATGMWDEKLLLWQDVELHLRSLLHPLKYAKRLDLKPDVFLRISDVSLSRTGFHSYPKFQSRLQVLFQTLEQAKNRGVLEKHKAGLQSMATDILVNAANSSYIKEAEGIFEMLYAFQLFDKEAERGLKHYVWLRRNKLYKIPFLQKRAYALLPKNDIVLKSSLNKVSYTDPIEL